MVQLAQIYVKGDGIERNISEAIRLYQIAITFNDPFAMVQFAQIYVQGDDIKRNISRNYSCLSNCNKMK
jgi:TPR repeat protein